MKLFAVFYILGKVAAVIGPWPDGSMEACLKGKAEIEANADRDYAKEPIKIVGGEKVTRKDFHFACEMHDARPELGTFKKGISDG